MKTRRNTPLRFGSIEDGIYVSITVYVIVVVVGSLLGLGAYAIAQGDHNSRQNGKTDIAKLVYSFGSDAEDLSPATVQKRKDVAQKIVNAYNQLKEVYGTDYTTIPSAELKIMQEVAETGQPVPVTDHRWKTGSYFRFVFLWPGLPILLLLLGPFLFIGYISEHVRLRRREIGHHYIADLPWRKPWTWFLTFGFGPIGWLAMAISGLCLRRVKPVAPVGPVVHTADLPAVRLAASVPQPIADIDDDFDDYEDPLRFYRMEETRPKTYVSSPQAARAFYGELRLQLLKTRRTARLDAVIEEIKACKEKLKEYAVKIQKRQRRIAVLTTEQQVIEQAMSELDNTDDPQVVSEEFDRLLALPGVLAVQVVNERLRLIVRACHTYQGVRYDFGDWQLEVGHDVYSLHAPCLREAVKPGWLGYPAYRLIDYSFCFGHRHSLINEHLAKGQYLEAMALAVECMSSVNPEDQHNVPEAFYPIKE